ncbi:MAG: NifU family protein [Smithellaceae bacterium]
MDVVGNRVIVATRGACATCKAAGITLKNFVEYRLKELVSPDLTVEEDTK